MDASLEPVELSCVVVNWNTKRFLLDCLRSIAATAGSLRTETIVVDNGSSDGSPDAVASEFPAATLVRNGTNLGFARANNVGIRRCTGAYVALVNSDVVVLDGCFQTLHDYMEEHPEVGVAGPRMLSTELQARRSTMSFPSLSNNLYRAVGLDSLFPRSRRFGSYLMAYQELRSIRRVDVLNGFFWMIRRTALDDVGLLDEGYFIYGEDIDLCRRMHRRGWACVFHPGASAIHHGAASSAREPVRFYVEMQKANMRYWTKHHGRRGSLAYRGVLLVHHSLRWAGQAVKCSTSRAARAADRQKMLRSRQAVRWLLGLAHRS